MNRHASRILALALLLTVAAVPLLAASAEEERKDIRKAHDQILAQLYKLQPSAKKAVQGAAGYAVFSNFGMKILVAGGGNGEGIAIDNSSKAATYMKMVEVQAGLGMGVKKFQLIWVFESQKAFDDFVNKGWTFGAQASASAKKGNEGKSYSGALAVSPGVWVYQLVKGGLALELTAKGTKYYKDDDLN
jgi:lipid-binding SYLF domain-containing protein